MFARLICSCFLSLGLLAQQQGPAPPGISRDFHISGTAVDSATGQPLPQTRVAIAPVAERDVFTTIVTTDDGHFLFSGLAPGKYTLTAQHRGYLTRAFNQHDQFATSIVVGPGLPTDDLVFRLIAESAISGTVLDEHGDPVRDARVVLLQSAMGDGTRATRLRGITTTNDEGFYRFAHLVESKYFVGVVAEPWYAQRPTPEGTVRFSEPEHALLLEHPELARTILGKASGDAKDSEGLSLDVAYPLTFYPGVQDALAAAPVALNQGEQVSADMTLHPVPALHIRIPVETADQTQRSSLLLEQKVFDGIFVPAYTHAAQVAPGVLEIVGIAPGHYNGRIVSFSGGQMQTLQEREINASPDGEFESPVSAAHIPVKATFRFEPPAAAGQAVMQIRDKKWTRLFNERINAKNEVEFKEGLPAGSYEVSLQNGNGLYIKNISSVGARVTGRTLELKGNAPVSLTLTVAQGGGEVSGVALLEGKPGAGVMIVLVPADPAHNQVLFRRDQTDTDGGFSLANVVPGRYTLLAIADGWDLEWANPAVLKKFMVQGEAVTVETKGKYSVKVKVQ